MRESDDFQNYKHRLGTDTYEDEHFYVKVPVSLPENPFVNEKHLTETGEMIFQW